jgi:hypothetical protein
LKRSTTTVPATPPITKPLFEAGIQCSKRLYLDHNHPERSPEPAPHQQELLEFGRRLVELASQAFPKGTDLADLSIDDAIQKTRELLESGKPGVLFHAAFRGGGAEVRTDIVLIAGQHEIDIFEVKAGTTIKPRHLTDVAMQIHAIEAGGPTVKSASVLHLDPRYVHDGTKDYPIHKLFKSEDVTSRARNQLERVQDQIHSFQAIVSDEAMLELPTGTWCRNPLPCPHLAGCIESGPNNPLVELPHLSAALERRLHEQAIESIDQLDPKQPGLSNGQRRAVRAIQEGRLVMEPFVIDELRDVDWPLSFVHVVWHLDPLPRFAKSRPWQKAPFAWSAHRIEKSGRVYHRSFVSASAEDPRPEALRTLAEEVKDAGTVVIHGRGWDERFRAQLEDMAALKTELRILLGAPLLEFGNLLYHGVYHPDFHGNFDLPTVYRVLTAELGKDGEEEIVGLADPAALEIADDAAAEEAYRKILAKRTRATTREKLAAELLAYVNHASAALLRLYRLLSS